MLPRRGCRVLRRARGRALRCVRRRRALGLSRGVPVELGAAVTATTPFWWSRDRARLGLVLRSHPRPRRSGLRRHRSGRARPLADRLRPGLRIAGAARTAVLIGVAPMLSFVLAIFLGESANAGLIGGAVLIVSAGASLSFERRRPEGYRTLGAVLAVLCAGLFAVRDTLVRAASDNATLDPLVRTVVSLAAAAIVVVAWAAQDRASLPAGARSRQGIPAGGLLPRRGLSQPDRRARPRAGHDRRAAQRDAVAVGRDLRRRAARQARGGRAAARRPRRCWSSRAAS